MHSMRATLVDDDGAFVTLVTRHLVRYGYAVSAEYTAAEGLRSVDRQVPDVLITDIRIGADDGWALAERVKGQHPALPIVIVTAYPTFEMHDTARYWQLPMFI